MAINNQQEPGFEMITTVSYNTAGVCAWHGNQQPTGAGFEMITTVSYNTAGVCAWHGNQQPTGTRL